MVLLIQKSVTKDHSFDIVSVLFDLDTLDLFRRIPARANARHSAHISVRVRLHVVFVFGVLKGSCEALEVRLCFLIEAVEN